MPSVEDKEEVKLDARVNLFEEQVLRALKLKPEKWKKLLSTPEQT